MKSFRYRISLKEDYNTIVDVVVDSHLSFDVLGMTDGIEGGFVQKLSEVIVKDSKYDFLGAQGFSINIKRILESAKKSVESDPIKFLSTVIDCLEWNSPIDSSKAYRELNFYRRFYSAYKLAEETLISLVELRKHLHKKYKNTYTLEVSSISSKIG